MRPPAGQRKEEGMVSLVSMETLDQGGIGRGLLVAVLCDFYFPIPHNLFSWPRLALLAANRNADVVKEKERARREQMRKKTEEERERNKALLEKQRLAADKEKKRTQKKEKRRL